MSDGGYKVRIRGMNIFFYIVLSGLFFKEQLAANNLYYSQVPVLCYHNITINEYKKETLWISEATLNEQLKTLHDSGYHTILPEQLYQYMVNGTPLPDKPIILSFDDSHKEHFSIVVNGLKKYDFKGVFFIMTFCIGKKGYMTAEEIKTLSDNGHAVSCHTFDHPSLTKIKANQWEQQIDKPRQLLEKITGRPVEYFAYPYGIWSETAINELKKRGLKAAFQLLGKESERAPVYTIRRMMVSGNWTGKELIQNFSKAFRIRGHPVE